MVFEKVKAIIAQELNVDADKITLDTHLVHDLGADSLDAVSLIMALEDEYGVEFTEDAAQEIKCVKDIVNYIENYK